MSKLCVQHSLFSILFWLVSHFRICLIILIIWGTFAVNGDTVESRNINEFPNNGSHWMNCTIDGVVHYDKECFNWIENFITWIGLGIFVIFFLLCGCLWFCLCTICRIICCTEHPRDAIYSTYVYPTTYTQIP